MDCSKSDEVRSLLDFEILISSYNTFNEIAAKLTSGGAESSISLMAVYEALSMVDPSFSTL